METTSVGKVFDEWARQGRAEGMEKGHGYAVDKALTELAFSEKFSFLDFGCGNGWVVRRMSNHPQCTEAWGIDLSAEMILKAESKKSSEREFYVSGDIRNLSFEKTFDFVFSMEALYYSVPMEPVLKALVSRLRSKGRILVGVDFYMENAESHAWPQDLDVQMDLRSMEQWKEMFEGAGLANVSQKHVRYPQTEEMKKARKVHGQSVPLTWKQTIGTLFTYGEKL